MTPWTAASQSCLSFTISHSLLTFLSIEAVMPSNHLILCCPFLFLPSVFPSIRVFSSESALFVTWPKDWSFSFSISPSNEYSGLISFRTDWLDLLAVQGTLKSLPQHQFQSLSSLTLSLLYSSVLTSVHGYRKNHLYWKFIRLDHHHHPHTYPLPLEATSLTRFPLSLFPKHN